MRFICVVAVIALAACGDPFNPIDHLRVEALVSSTTVSPTDPITIGVKLTNVSSRTIEANNGTCPPLFDVVAATGEVVGPHRRTLVCAAILTTVKLSPGESHTIEFKWDGGGESGVLPAGNYAIRANYAGKLSEESPITLEN